MGVRGGGKDGEACNFSNCLQKLSCRGGGCGVYVVGGGCGVYVVGGPSLIIMLLRLQLKVCQSGRV